MGTGDKIKHNAEELVGKGKEKIGELKDDERLKAEGKLDQAKAKAKQAGDEIKDKLDR